MSLDRRGFLGRLTAVVAVFSASNASPAAKAVALPAAPAPAKGGLVTLPPKPTPPPAKTALGHVAGGGGGGVSSSRQSDTMKMVTDLLADCAVVSMSLLTFGVGELAKMEVVYAYDPDKKLRRRDGQLQADVAAMLTPRSGITSVSVESVCDSVDITDDPWGLCRRTRVTRVTDYRIVVEWLILRASLPDREKTRKRGTNLPAREARWR